MPHLDFRQAFSTSSQPAPFVDQSGQVPFAPEENFAHQQRSALATRLPRLHRSDRATILFAIFVFVGGLFCAFYFFNGGEYLRAAAAWSREFLYPRPSALAAENAKIDNSKLGSEPPQAPSDGAGRDARRHSTSPFSSDLGSLYPATFNNSASAGSAQATVAPGVGSLLSQLDIPAPGGDTLLQSFNRTVDNMVRATNLFANSTATVVQTTVKQASVKNAQVKSATQNATSVAAGNLSAKQNGQAAARTINRQTQATTSTVRSLGNNLGLQGGGIQDVLGAGGLGDGIRGLGSGAGMGGVGGGGEGAVGGAMGGAGGAIGGLTGGH